MYHALVKDRDGHWVSYGVHNPANQWSLIFQTLVRAYGEESVGYVYWLPHDPAMDPFAMGQRVETDVRQANEAQRAQNIGALPSHEDGEHIHIAGLISLMKEKGAMTTTTTKDPTSKVAEVLANWGVRSHHGEWTDAEAQRDCARDVLKVLGANASEPDPEPLARFLAAQGISEPGKGDWDHLTEPGRVIAMVCAQQMLSDLRNADDELRQSLLAVLL